MFKEITLLLLICFSPGFSQVIESDENIPYKTIPVTDSIYSAGSLSARLIDGLGFRFYWATEGLTKNELENRIAQSSRNIEETIDHIYTLTNIIVYTIDPESTLTEEKYDVFKKRQIILEKLKKASYLLSKSNATDFYKYNTIFSNGTELPFWNLINGPISDAIWHCGQIAMLRRVAGNPFPSEVSLFNGKLREN